MILSSLTLAHSVNSHTALRSLPLPTLPCLFLLPNSGGSPGMSALWSTNSSTLLTFCGHVAPYFLALIRAQLSSEHTPLPAGLLMQTATLPYSLHYEHWYPLVPDAGFRSLFLIFVKISTLLGLMRPSCCHHLLNTISHSRKDSGAYLKIVKSIPRLRIGYTVHVDNPSTLKPYTASSGTFSPHLRHSLLQPHLEY